MELIILSRSPPIFKLLWSSMLCSKLVFQRASSARPMLHRWIFPDMDIIRPEAWMI